ncbi:MAG: radical SAM protein [Candidatus Bathyarchaeia archaeon]
MEIVKAEFLWTRVCPLKCEYCSMADGRKNTLPLARWWNGIDQLKKLGCGFIAFYGAEPLADFDNLPEVVGYAEKRGVHTTVITSGVVSRFYEKLEALHAAGAKSLSMSYDIIDQGSHGAEKTQKALKGLHYFQLLGDIRDVAVITTLTKANYPLLPQSIREMSKRGIWSLFDFIHWDRGQPGSKCRNYDGIDDLKFSEDDLFPLVIVLTEAMKLKEMGFLCHTSQPFINRITANKCEYIRKYNWNCADEPGFPAWVTVDCDGTVYPCDDFQMEYRGREPIMVDQIYDRWEEFGAYWQPIVKARCPGCMWNTHLDAHFIKNGVLPFSDYVHTP